MITLDGIFENLIAELIVVVISFLSSRFMPPLIFGREEIETSVKYDPLKISIFLAVLSVFNLILNLSFWNNQNLMMLFTLLSLVFVALTVYIYNNQCPSCKKFINAKKRTDAKIIKKFKKSWKYQPRKIYRYTNGATWKEVPIGKEKSRDENWITRQEFYKCAFCKHEWDSGHFDVNLDEKTRPRPEIINTDKHEPPQETEW